MGRQEAGMGHRNSLRRQKKRERWLQTKKIQKKNPKHMLCGIWDLSCQTRDGLSPLKWKLRVLTTGPSGESLKKRL